MCVCLYEEGQPLLVGEHPLREEHTGMGMSLTIHRKEIDSVLSDGL
jgi:hypothetical protein